MAGFVIPECLSVSEQWNVKKMLAYLECCREESYDGAWHHPFRVPVYSTIIEYKVLLVKIEKLSSRTFPTKQEDIGSIVDSQQATLWPAEDLRATRPSAKGCHLGDSVGADVDGWKMKVNEGDGAVLP
jgi:hypothetical protein